MQVSMGLLYLLKGCLFILLLTAASVIDIKKRIIPDKICLLIALAGIIPLEPLRLLGILAALPFLLAALFNGGMGGGDIKLMAASGIFLGIMGGIAASVISLTAMLLFYFIYSIIQRLSERECRKAFPFAPFLSVGCIVIYFISTGGIQI